MVINTSGDMSMWEMALLFLLIMPGVAIIAGIISYLLYWIDNLHCGITCALFKCCDCKKAHAKCSKMGNNKQ